MIRALCILLATCLLAPLTGCASDQHLHKRLGLMEDEIADLRQANRKINQRIDELQIQLSLINKKLADRPEPRVEPGPALKVVKLRPRKTTKKAKTRIKFPDKRSGMKEIDPRKVSERLPIDTQAARRTLWGLDSKQ
jgi:hypothetical protein